MDRERGISLLPWLMLAVLLEILAGSLLLIYYDALLSARILALLGAGLFLPIICWSFFKYLKHRKKRRPITTFFRIKMVITLGLAAVFLTSVLLFIKMASLIDRAAFIESFKFYLRFPGFLFQAAGGIVSSIALIIYFFRILIKYIYVNQLNLK